MEDDLLMIRRQLATRVIAEAEGAHIDEAVKSYMAARRESYGRLTRFMRSVARDGVNDLAALTVAVRRIRTLVG